MEEAVDGDYQTYKSRNGAFVREHFFGGMPGLAERVAHMTDAEIWALNRGGLDARKVYAAYAEASRHEGQPTVILAKTIKGYGMGTAGEGQNITHQQKKMNEEALLAFRDRFELPLTDEQVRNYEYYRPPDDSPEMKLLRERRAALGGSLPARRTKADSLEVPELSVFKGQVEGSGDREISTTMAFVRILAALVRDKEIGRRVVPIVPDESRTFGMEGMFRQLGIFSQVGQLYQPEDSEQLMFYREDRQGQILQEGINEPGAFSSWIAAATSYSNSDTPMIPFYVYYSMFGFQRIGDLAWAAGDSRARGFLIGGTAGRTTLNGEGLQHEDGHSLVQAALIPNCVSYDPAYGYELAVIVHDGLRRMYGEQEDVFYYLTVMNENYRQPALPEGAEEGILKGIHRVREAGQAEAGSVEDPETESAAGAKDADADGLVEDDGGEAADGDVEPADAGAGEHDSQDGDPAATPKDLGAAQVRLLGSGTILREVIAAAELLEQDWGVAADVYSVTSYTELRREGLAVQRQNWLHPEDEPQTAYVTEVLAGDTPIVASSDYVRELAEGIRPFIDAPYFVLGTDGYGRSDYRKALRGFFEVDRRHVVLAALTELAKKGEVEPAKLTEAIETYEIKTDEGVPWAR
jgi:pyruvate dehydrogenase E1 component